MHPPDGINRPEVVAEITALLHGYEAALMANDLERLGAFFWDSPLVTRYGIADRQWGAQALRHYRAATPVPGFTRSLHHPRISTFGDDTAAVQVEFVRSDTALRGFQTQIWRRFPAGWKIVAAHVSMIPWSEEETGT
ncbi:nuclear transport factor 2 family protein [Acidovorax sp. NCPPB 2350]|nr:nuclear transport factor 2 family protein [Acidovorax sp. NCPPB 2350]